MVVLVALWMAPAGAAPSPGSNPDLTLRAVLIWGTDGARPDDPELKDLDVDTREKLRAVFKWKHYYEVSRKDIALSGGAAKRVRLSPKCEVAVQSLGKSTVEVKLFGDGKLVVTKKQVMSPGELLVLAGEDKNDTAWFVALNRLEKK
jgi:hypothetical protein